MKSITKYLGIELITLFLFFTFTTTAYAKRSPAPEVPAVVYHGVVYSASYHKGGVIDAYSVKTKHLLWKKQIYFVKYNPHLERDVQDVYIKKMKLHHGHLLIKDERNRVYSLDLYTHRVRMM